MFDFIQKSKINFENETSITFGGYSEVVRGIVKTLGILVVAVILGVLTKFRLTSFKGNQYMEEIQNIFVLVLVVFVLYGFYRMLKSQQEYFNKIIELSNLSDNNDVNIWNISSLITKPDAEKLFWTHQKNTELEALRKKAVYRFLELLFLMVFGLLLVSSV